MILDRYLVRQFFPVFLVASSMFVMILSIIDLFANLLRYLNNEVPLAMIGKISLYYLPKSFSYAMPISLLFAAAYTIGDLYSRNELTTVFSSGIPFRRFSMPLVLIGALASVFSFFFDDMVVIPTIKIKNDLSSQALHQVRADRSSGIVVKAQNGRVVYSVDYYDYEEGIINGISIIETDQNGKILSHVRAPSAKWTGEYWEFYNAIIYRFEDDMLRVRPLGPVTSYTEHPDTFRRSAVNVEELSARDAGLLVRDLRSSGLPFADALASYYHRFSFAVTSFIVMILSVSMGGKFRKNILLMSLFSSLAAAVVYYVMEMVSMAMAGLGYIPPAVGAWFPVVTFIVIGVFMVRGART
jgi:lipopolysaccharide export system permease protein